MPIISMFYGIIVRMFNFDNQKHNKHHVHVEYQDYSCVFDIESGEILEGKLTIKSARLVQAWIEIHKDELLADWKLAVNGEKIFKIKPLD